VDGEIVRADNDVSAAVVDVPGAPDAGPAGSVADVVADPIDH
jgi:hypothetical protein